MRVQDFLAQHPVFRIEKFEAFLETDGPRSKKTRDALLAYHLKAGHLLRITRGIYASVPRGFDPSTFPVDPYLVATHLASDAVVGYHSALQFHGKSASIHHQVQYLTRTNRQPLQFRDNEFTPVLLPKSLRGKKRSAFGVETLHHTGGTVRVTSFERTMVDVLARPDLGGGWEEVWLSLQSIEFLHLDQVVKYTLMLDNSTVAARVGFFLEQHREALMVEDRHLRRLRRHAPRQPCYLERRRTRPARLIKGWNLRVPLALLNRDWEESV